MLSSLILQATILSVLPSLKYVAFWTVPRNMKLAKHAKMQPVIESAEGLL